MGIARSIQELTDVLIGIRQDHEKRAVDTAQVRRLDREVNGLRDRIYWAEQKIKMLELTCPGVLKVECPHLGCTTEGHFHRYKT